MKLKSLLPWRERTDLEQHPFYGLQRDINRMFDDFWKDFDFPVTVRNGYHFKPDVDIVENDDAYVITAELPGLKPEDVHLTVTDGILNIKGEKKQEVEEKKENFYRMERSYGTFARVIPLPADTIVEDKIAATFKDGILTVTIPKVPEAQVEAKEIAIEAS